MKSRVLIVDDDLAIVDGLTSLLLLTGETTFTGPVGGAQRNRESGIGRRRISNAVYGLDVHGLLYLRAKKKMQMANSLRGTC